MASCVAIDVQLDVPRLLARLDQIDDELQEIREIATNILAQTLQDLWIKAQIWKSVEPYLNEALKGVKPRDLGGQFCFRYFTTSDSRLRSGANDIK